MSAAFQAASERPTANASPAANTSRPAHAANASRPAHASKASPVARGLAAAAQALVRALWLYALPALLSGLTLKFLVPSVGTGFRGWVATAGHQYPVGSLTVMFLIFSALGHYWRFHVPGGRYASALPYDWAVDERAPARLRAWAEIAETHRALAGLSPATRTRSMDEGTQEELTRELTKLDRAIEAADLDGAEGAARSAARLATTARATRAWRHAAMTLGTLALVAAAALGLRAKVAQSYEVIGASMLPTLEPNDRIAANKLAYGASHGVAGGVPARGDVVVFRAHAVALGDAIVPDILVKRVIGLPGDVITMDTGTPIINGWTLPSCDAGPYLYVLPGGDGEVLQGRVRVEYLDDRTYLTVHVPSREPMDGPYVVKPGEVFVLGDNRANSLDSRSWNQGRGGGVPFGAIEGRAQWFLVGTHRSGEADLSRMRHLVDSTPRTLRIEGLDATALDRGIARCLGSRPKDTRPPAPGTQPTTSGS